MKEHGDKLDKAEKEKIEASLKDLQEAIKSDNKDEIEAKNKALAEASQKLGEKVYAEQQAQQQIVLLYKLLEQQVEQVLVVGQNF